MEEKKLPWWRRALSVALDGLKSGFGLFARSPKEDVEQKPDNSSGDKLAEDQIEFAAHVPEQKPAIEGVRGAAAAAAAAPAIGPEVAIASEQAEETLPAVDLEPEVETQPIDEIAEAPVEMVAEPVGEEEPSAAVEIEAETLPEPAIVNETASAIEEAAGVGPYADVEVEPAGRGDAAVVEELPAEVIEETPVPAEEPSAASVIHSEETAPEPVAVVEEAAAPVAEVTEIEEVAAHEGTLAMVVNDEPAPHEMSTTETSALATETAEPEPLVEADTPVEEIEAAENWPAEAQDELLPEEARTEAAEERSIVTEEISSSLEQAPARVDETARVSAEAEGAEPAESGVKTGPEEPFEGITGVTEPIVEQTVKDEIPEQVAEETVEVPETENCAPPEADLGAEPKVEINTELPTEISTPEEPVAEAPEAHTELDEEPVQEAEDIEELAAEPEPEAEVEADSEPAMKDAASLENVPAADAVLEMSAPPVELDESALEQAQEVATEQTAANEVEEVHEAAFEPLTADEAAYAMEVSPAPEEGIVELDQPMELNEPIREPEAEPVQETVPEPIEESPTDATASNEVAPAPEVIVAEEVPVAEQEGSGTVVEAVAGAETAATEALPQESDSESVVQPEPESSAQHEAGQEPAGEGEPAAHEPASQATHKPFIKLQSRDNEADLSPFSVIVSEVYDGPLDLLLDLIRKQDIDIYDIPIARITAQFLAYVNQLKGSDVDVAGEFIYMASLLIHIKSKMLLPRAPTGPEDAAEDPRRELVERLLEHERFKNAAQMLQQKQMLEAATWTNPGVREFKDDESTEPEIAADTVDLVRVFRDILERARNRPVINLEEDSVTVGQMIQFLSRRLTMEDKPIALHRLLSNTQSERALIAMFLALLELVRLQAILLRQDKAFSEIFIKKNTAFESVMNEGLANAKDDWQ